MPNKQDNVIFLDALDEDTLAIKDHRARIRALLSACSNFKAVVITCRTQFFLRDEEIPRDVGIVRVGPRPGGEGATYEFWKLYLAPFDDKDVQSYIRRRYPWWARKRRNKAERLIRLAPKLSIRPMLLAHLPEVIDSEREVRKSVELYTIMIDAWCKREAGWIAPDDLLRFSRHIAVDMYTHREDRGMEALPARELALKATEANLPHLEQWQLTGRSLLNRDVNGLFKFSHRSIMEFMVVQFLMTGKGLDRPMEITDQMTAFCRDYGITGFVAAERFRAPTAFEASTIGKNLTETPFLEIGFVLMPEIPNSSVIFSVNDRFHALPDSVGLALSLQAAQQIFENFPSVFAGEKLLHLIKLVDLNGVRRTWRTLSWPWTSDLALATACFEAEIFALFGQADISATIYHLIGDQLFFLRDRGDRSSFPLIFSRDLGAPVIGIIKAGQLRFERNFCRHPNVTVTEGDLSEFFSGWRPGAPGAPASPPRAGGP